MCVLRAVSLYTKKYAYCKLKYLTLFYKLFLYGSC